MATDYFEIKTTKLKDIILAGENIEHKYEDNTKEITEVYPAQQRLSNYLVNAGDTIVYTHSDGSTEEAVLDTIKNKTGQDSTALYFDLATKTNVFAALNGRLIDRGSKVVPKVPVLASEEDIVIIEVLQYELSDGDIYLAAIDGLLLDKQELTYKP